jgi:isoquinoline 1-oxidoreductase subunit beta
MMLGWAARKEDEVVEARRSIRLSRRTFLLTGAAVGGGLLLGFALPLPFTGKSTAATADSFEPDAFIRVGQDGSVTLTIPQVEMGQGTFTSCPMLLAEELEVDLSQVHVAQAPPSDKLYGNPLLGFQVTGGSTSIRAFYKPLREAGAAARAMLIAAAANDWGVDPSTCRADEGEVIHEPTGRKLSYGELADKAATLSPPHGVVLKDPKDFKLIGTPAKRLDTPAKVNGTAVYGIDVKVPGMKIATVAACPVFGGKLKNVDDSKAFAVKGVHQVVHLHNAVCVVADHMGAAKKGLAALEIEWDEGPNAKLTTADIVADMAKASEAEGAVVRNEGDVAGALAGASTKLDAVYELPFLAHTTIEPINCTVHVRQDGCDIWVATQVISRSQAVAAQFTGLPPEKVAVHNHLLGGGFGRRLEVDFIAQAAAIGKQVDGPVKIVWTREEDVQHDMYRPAFYDRMAAGLDAQGMPVAWSHRICGSSIIARWAPPVFKNRYDPDTIDGAVELPYSFPNVRLEYVQNEPKGIQTAFWRSVGPSHNIFVVSGWGQLLPQGSGRRVSAQNVFGSYMAQVAEVAVSEGRRSGRQAHHLCGRLRNCDQSQHHRGAGAKRHHLRSHRSALRRDHAERRPGGAQQFRQLSSLAHQ